MLPQFGEQEGTGRRSSSGGRTGGGRAPQPFSASRSGSVPWKTKGPGGRGGEEKPDEDRGNRRPRLLQRSEGERAPSPCSCRSHQISVFA
ncbi:hypothetical protein AV530_019286 [Patagioenas fasciata monilis]|uniref:Uncharacterized protein n=1 Tax=Patagioenas fasciata monilis TaxID=372326 RepID=A0A1V4JDB9_PATFA|nr:hypothetical protein AV530_019286 [Patagioenas fasciata monilis]